MTGTNGKYITWPRVATAALVVIGGLLTLLWRGQEETSDRITRTQEQQAETLERVSRTQEGMSYWIKAVEKDVAENRNEINRLRDE